MTVQVRLEYLIEFVRNDIEQENMRTEEDDETEQELKRKNDARYAQRLILII
jgi:hypothetical protein